MKIVSRISPIEATRYLENAETQKKGKRNGRKNVTVFSMAMANVTGNQKNHWYHPHNGAFLRIVCDYL